MDAILSKLLEQLNSSVFTLLFILGGAFWATYKISGIITHFQILREKNTENDVNICGIKDTLASMKATLDLLYHAHLATVQTKSPLSLSDIGSVIAKDLDIVQKVGTHWNEIVVKIEEKNPSNPYDVQIVAMEGAEQYFSTIFSKEEQEGVKLYAYQHGNNLREITPIIGIIIRDKYLKEKGIATEEIDRHAPITKNE